MFWKILFFNFFICYTSGQRFNEFHFVDPFSNFNWPNQRQNIFHEIRDLDEIAEREREPLDPNYQDPVPAGSDEKPVLQPKPTEKPSYNPDAIPGGVIDVDANGQFPASFPQPDFTFSSIGGGNRFPGSGGGLFGLGGFFGAIGDSKPWWKGPNVCIEREESSDDDDDEDEDKVAGEEKPNTSDDNKNETEKVPNLFSTAISLSNCHQTANKYECVTKINNHGVVKTFTVRYKCCYGFERTKGTSGCEKQLEMKPLLDTIDVLDAKVFRNLIQTAGLDDTFKNGNFTLFVPTDIAVNEFTEKMVQLNHIDLNGDGKNALPNNDLVLSHAVAGFIDLTDYVNEDIIYSENKNSSLRINTYPTLNYDKMITVNCARITKANNLATNGIAHLIDHVAVPATQSLQEIIKENKKLTNLKQILETTDSFKNLRANGHYTIFAPTDEAFDKLGQSTKQKLLKGDACAISILKHHVISHTVCSAAIAGNATTHNIEGELLNLERTADDVIVLEDKAKILESDIVGTNGVVHLIDTVLIPDSALHINAVLENENLTKFRALIEEAGLTDYIDNLNNSTVFAPADEAFTDPKTVKLLEDIKDDKEKLKDLILYHTLRGQLESYEMNNNALLKTNDHDKEVRLNLYSTLPLFTNVINRATINCGRVLGFDEKSCGSVIHEIDRVLVPPMENILELINKDAKYSTLSEIIKETEVEKILQESNRSITFLAPTDETFAAISEADLKTLKTDKERADAVLKNHILTEVLCCSGVGPQSFGFNTFVQSLSKQHHQVGRTGGHQIRFGRAVVTSCDNLATNGVLHTVNKVLFPQRPASPSFGGFFLFDL